MLTHRFYKVFYYYFFPTLVIVIVFFYGSPTYVPTPNSIIT